MVETEILILDGKESWGSRGDWKRWWPAMTIPLTWIAGLSSQLQSSITSTTMHTAMEQLDYTGQR